MRRHHRYQQRRVSRAGQAVPRASETRSRLRARVKSAAGQPHRGFRHLANVAPGSRSAARALSVLTAINLLNYLDRYVVPPIVPELKGAMGLSDTQVGWLVPAFMIVYMIAAPVFGAWGDRGSRTRPIALGVFVWSLATVLSGLARSYPQLLAGRALVGIGEAAYVAIAPVLLADCFPVSGRGRVYSVLNMAIPVGSALGIVLGGLIGHHFGWRAAFFVAGAPGMLLAAAVLWLPAPPRGAQDASPVASAPRRVEGRTPGPVAVYLSFLRRAPYMLLVLGYAAYTFALGGLGFWMPTFLERVRAVPAVEATTGLGAILVVTGFPGPFNAAIVNIVSPLERASAIALSMFAIHLLGDVPSPVLIGYLSDVGSLARAVLVVPVAIAIGGIVWLACARVSARTPAAPA